MSPFSGDSFSHEVAILLGLTPTEFDHIDAAIQQTKQRLNDLALNAATAHVSADGKTLIVTVPPLPNEGDSLYANLLNTITQVLGPERFQLFNEITGDTFDSHFDRFGLNPVTYELTLQPADVVGGTPRYFYRRSYTDANGKSTGWSSATVSRSSLENSYPVLAHFFPSDFGKQATPP